MNLQEITADPEVEMPETIVAKQLMRQHVTQHSNHPQTKRKADNSAQVWYSWRRKKNIV